MKTNVKNEKNVKNETKVVAKGAKVVNMFTANLSGRNLIAEKSATKKAVKTALADFGATIDAEFTKVIKSTDQRARNTANACKGKFQTAIKVVEKCYPFQTKDGVLCTKVKTETGDKVWAAKKLTATSARAIVRESLNNFIKNVGAPAITFVVIGEKVETEK